MFHLKLSFAILFFIQIIYTLKVCEKTSRWRLSNRTFPDNYRGKVKLVALLKASCGFCRVQAAKLEELRNELIKENKTRISFVIVNSHDYDSVFRASIFKKVTKIPYVQDIAKIDVWGTYNGSTDDMLIFDKCNRLVSQLSLPDSLVVGGKVKDEILRAYDKEPCGSICKHVKENKRINLI